MLSNGKVAPMDKLPDSEIVKALEEELKTALIINHRFEESNDTENPDDHRFIALLSRTIKLINRLQSKVEHYKKSRDDYQDKVMFIAKQCDELQAENERLEEENEKQYENARDTIRAEIADGGTSCHWCEDTIRGVAKAEAYKECVEKVKETSNKMELVCSGALVRTDYTITEKELDNILKEIGG